MIAFRTKTALGLLLLAWASGSALADPAPLAMPPSPNEPAAVAPPPATPEALGLAIPASTTAPAAVAPLSIVPAPVAAPVATTTPAATAAAAPAAPIINTTPVDAAPLKDIKPDSIGLMALKEGGLGATMWKGTSRAFVERFMPMLVLPLPYASLNQLAVKFLLTTAAAPDGADAATNPQNLTALRIQKLIALGKATEAWQLATLAGTDSIDDATLRLAAENAMVSAAADDACARLPALVQKHTGIEWQKIMLVCQLRAKDAKAAQVTIDLLHAQDVHDDSFFALAEKNILVAGKQLPRQLTPLKPLTLAMLGMVDLPLRSELYTRPDAALIPALLRAKPLDEKARLDLAERAAARGLITADDLAAIYTGQNFPAESFTSANLSGEQGPMLRALLYQAALQEKTAKNRIADAERFEQSLDLNSAGGGVLTLNAAMLGDVKPDPAFNENAAAATRILLLAGKNDAALAWLDQAHTAARGSAQAVDDLHNLWPLLVLGSLESDAAFAHDLDSWLAITVKDPNATDDDTRAQKNFAASLLLLMNATGFTIPDDTWAKLGDTPTPDKRLTVPVLVMEQLRSAGAADHKGAAILMGLLASIGSKREDAPLPAILATIRALRAIGLTGDAGQLAEEAGLRLLYAPIKP